LLQSGFSGTSLWPLAGHRMLSPVFFHGYLRKYPSPPDGFIMLIARTSTAETMQLITESKGAKAIAIAAKKKNCWSTGTTKWGRNQRIFIKIFI